MEKVLNNKNLEDNNNLKLKKLEDDFKNIINEKDEIIRNMNDKLLLQENKIKEQSEKIEKLFQKMNEMNKLNEKLNKLFNYNIEISGADNESKELKGISFEFETFDENSFDNYFKIENGLKHDKLIFSFCQKKNNNVPIKELEKLLQKYKNEETEFILRESNNCIFMDFYLDIKKNDDKDGRIIEEKDNNKENKVDFYEIIDLSKILKNSNFFFNLKINFETEFLFKDFKENIEKVATNLLNFNLTANYDINTKLFLSFIFEKLLEDNENENEKKNIKYLKELFINYPFQKLKYILTDNNKKDIYNNIIIGNFKELKELLETNSFEKLFEDISKDFNKEKKEEIKEILELFYKILDFNKLSFAFGYTNNKLGFKIRANLKDENKIIFVVFSHIITLFTNIFE